MTTQKKCDKCKYGCMYPATALESACPCECHKSTPKDSMECWEERFDKEFKSASWGGVMPKHRDGGVILHRDLIRFIHSELALATSEAKREEREKIVGLVREEAKKGRVIVDLVKFASSLESSLEDKGPSRSTGTIEGTLGAMERMQKGWPNEDKK